MKKYLVVDLDGTLCDSSHRVHFLEQEPKDWDSFYAGIADDPINWHIDKLVKCCYYEEDSQYDLVFLTGRSDKHRKITEDWLFEHGYYSDMYDLFMRTTNDWRPDHIVKLELAKANNITPDNVEFILEDRNQVVNMWRTEGYKCLQVSEGNF